MKHFRDEWIKEWCQENGWTDLFMDRYSYWAFPPGGVMPLPIPKETLLEIKAAKGFSPQEKIWLAISTSISILAGILSYGFNSPMPLVFAFAFVAITVGKLEIE